MAVPAQSSGGLRFPFAIVSNYSRTVAAGGVYRLTSPGALRWREWNGEAVVFNPLSGNSHRVPAAAAEVLRYLEAQPASLDQLAAELSALVPEREAELRTWLAALVAQFEQAGLVECG